MSWLLFGDGLAVSQILCASFDGNIFYLLAPVPGRPFLISLTISCTAAAGAMPASCRSSGWSVALAGLAGTDSLAVAAQSADSSALLGRLSQSVRVYA